MSRKDDIYTDMASLFAGIYDPESPIPEHRMELHPELQGVNGTDPWVRGVSSPRKTMYDTQIGQSPVVKGAEQRRCFTGMELLYGDEAFNIQLPEDAEILEVLRRYIPGRGEDSIRHNPETTIIYEHFFDPHKTVGMIHLKEFDSYHQDFGFRLNRNDEVCDRIEPGAKIEKGAILARSTSFNAEGCHGLGVEAEVAFMTHPGTTEDGFVMSDEFMEKMTARSYHTVIGSFGKNHFPLNLYGDERRYKPFPDIGDKIGKAGFVMALRDNDPLLGIAEMTPRALRTPNHSFDRVLWGKPGATIVDIKVFHDDAMNPPFTPKGMDDQARKYYDDQATYYRRVLKVFERLKQRRGKKLQITPEFNQLVVEAKMFLPVEAGRKLTRMYRLETLDEWRVEITYEWEMPAGEGYKFSDFVG